LLEDLVIIGIAKTSLFVVHGTDLLLTLSILARATAQRFYIPVIYKRLRTLTYINSIAGDHFKYQE